MSSNVLEKDLASVHDSASDHNFFDTQSEGEVGAHGPQVVADNVPYFMIISKFCDILNRLKLESLLNCHIRAKTFDAVSAMEAANTFKI